LKKSKTVHIKKQIVILLIISLFINGLSLIVFGGSFFDQTFNDPPIAEIVSVDPNPGLVGQQINFTGRGFDPENGTMYFSWDFDGDNVWEIINYTINGSNWQYHYVNYTYFSPGNYNIIFMVSDLDGAFDIDTAVVEIQGPIANFSYTPENPSTQDIIQFNDTSLVYNVTIISWYWDFGDGNNSDLQDPTHKYDDDGIYNVTLTVTDNNSVSDSISKYVPVSNTPPVANAGGPYIGNVNEDILFDGSGSYDLDGSIISWYWDFGDGNIGYGETILHSYNNSGSYQVTLTVTDDDYAIDNDTTTVYINTPPNPPIISGPLYGKPNVSYNFTFIINDPDGDQLYYLVDLGDGNTSGWLGPFNSGETIKVSYYWSEPGNYIIKVKLRDSYGGESDWSDGFSIIIVRLRTRFFLGNFDNRSETDDLLIIQSPYFIAFPSDEIFYTGRTIAISKLSFFYVGSMFVFGGGAISIL